MTVAAQAGRNFLIKEGATPTTVAGVRATKLAINGSPVDITNKGSAGHQEWLVGAGVDNFELTGSGVYMNTDPGLVALQTAAMPGTLALLSLTIVDGITGEKYVGLFAIPTFEIDAPFNTERTFSITCRSHGAIAYTPGA